MFRNHTETFIFQWSFLYHSETLVFCFCMFRYHIKIFIFQWSMFLHHSETLLFASACFVIMPKQLFFIVQCFFIIPKHYLLLHVSVSYCSIFFSTDQFHFHSQTLLNHSETLLIVFLDGRPPGNTRCCWLSSDIEMFRHITETLIFHFSMLLYHSETLVFASACFGIILKHLFF